MHSFVPDVLIKAFLADLKIFTNQNQTPAATTAGHLVLASGYAGLVKS